MRILIPGVYCPNKHVLTRLLALDNYEIWLQRSLPHQCTAQVWGNPGEWNVGYGACWLPEVGGARTLKGPQQRCTGPRCTTLRHSGSQTQRRSCQTTVLHTHEDDRDHFFRATPKNNALTAGISHPTHAPPFHSSRHDHRWHNPLPWGRRYSNGHSVPRRRIPHEWVVLGHISRLARGHRGVFSPPI